LVQAVPVIPEPLSVPRGVPPTLMASGSAASMATRRTLKLRLAR
jgi:hypothetical protein